MDGAVVILSIYGIVKSRIFWHWEGGAGEREIC